MGFLLDRYRGGILYLLVAVGDITIPAGKFPELAFWFFPLAAITASAAVASVGQNLGITATLVSLAGGAALLAIGYLVGGGGALPPPVAGRCCCWSRGRSGFIPGTRMCSRRL